MVGDLPLREVLSLDTEFRPAWWLPGPHLQTAWGRLARSRRQVRFRREVLETPDGDDLVLDHMDGPAGSPRLLLLHGLEGSSHSVYAQGLLAQAGRRGWRATAINFRSCAVDPRRLSRRLPNRRPRLYHSGETSDFDFAARTIAAREPAIRLGAAGVSLGGNVLLKWLGENPDQRIVARAAAISTPYDLAAGARHLERRMGRIYVRSLLSTLREKALAAARTHPEAAATIDVERTRRAKTFREFDDAATAPLHGFASAEDYYERSSSIRYLGSIRTPTLCLSAEDDPFVPAQVLERARAAASPAVRFVITRHGGHVGFVSSGKARYWAEELVLEWLTSS